MSRARPFLLLALLLLPLAARAQIVNVQALFDETAPQGLSAALEGSADWRTGSTDVLLLRGGAVGQYKVGSRALLGALRGEYGWAKGTVISSRLFEHLRYRQRVSDWLAAEAFAQHEFDRFRRLELRALLGAGPRFTLWPQQLQQPQAAVQERTYERQLVVGVALMAELERLQRDAQPDAGQRTLDARVSSYVLGRLKFRENVELVETFYVQPLLVRPRDFRIRNETQLTVQLTKQLSAGVGYVVTYDRYPPAGVPKLDTGLHSTLLLKLEPPPPPAGEQAG